MRFAINFKSQRKRGCELNRTLISADFGLSAEFLISPRAVCTATAVYAALPEKKCLLVAGTR